MPAREEVKGLLDRMGRAARRAGEPGWTDPLVGRQPAEVAPYRQHAAYPGESYVLIGNSFDAEHALIGTPLEARRAGCLTLMLETMGDSHHCVSLRVAMEYEGFRDVLSRFEREWLDRLPPETMIGPAYERNGRRIRAAFAVWQPAERKSPAQPQLAMARPH